MRETENKESFNYLSFITFFFVALGIYQVWGLATHRLGMEDVKLVVIAYMLLLTAWIFIAHGPSLQQIYHKTFKRRRRMEVTSEWRRK